MGYADDRMIIHVLKVDPASSHDGNYTKNTACGFLLWYDSKVLVLLNPFHLLPVIAPHTHVQRIPYYALLGMKPH